jgi:RimJ/RimL family protein N-acetyltransferase
MDLVDVWPLFGLRLFTPRLELRVARDEDIPSLAEAAIRGIHDPGRLPFAHAWTDEPPVTLRREMARYFWRERAAVAPGRWMLNFAVLDGGVPIGVQDLRAVEFTPLHTVSTGSWLTRSRQGAGLGTEMRVAILAFAFDHLGAEVAESGALDWNEASLGVSRKLGYRDNGVKRVTARPGTVEREVLLRLEPDHFVRPDRELRVEGVEGST